MAWDNHRWTVCYVNKFSGGSTLQAVDGFLVLALRVAEQTLSD